MVIFADLLHNQGEEPLYIYNIEVQDAVNFNYMDTYSYMAYYSSVPNSLVSFKAIDPDTGQPVPNIWAMDPEDVPDLSYDPTTGVCTFTMPAPAEVDALTIIADVEESAGKSNKRKKAKIKKLLAERKGK